MILCVTINLLANPVHDLELVLFAVLLFFSYSSHIIARTFSVSSSTSLGSRPSVETAQNIVMSMVPVDVNVHFIVMSWRRTNLR